MEEDELCFPQLLNTSCKKPKPPDSEAVFIYTMLFIMSLLTSLIILLMCCGFRQLHSPTNLVLLSLAVSDFFVGLLVIPIETLMTGTCWVLGDLLCALYFLIPYILISASVGSMVLISVDRYVAICDPMHYSTRITDKVVTVIVSISVGVCWIYSFFYGIFMSYDHLKQPGRYNSCYGECLVEVIGEVDLVAFFISIMITIVLYMRVFFVAVSQARAMRSHVAATAQYSMTLTMKKSELKAARTLGVVVIAFLLCYSPYYIVVLTDNMLVGSSTEAFMSLLMYFNSCLNPVIYAFFYPWFRKAVKHIVTLQILQPGSCDANVL
uniref:G-protein coupled receptors family 1 profile domain-containing protein n=1 Tax=Lates calcarifer TaxID=8187 RepID=A0A4W6ESF9_LATCA